VRGADAQYRVALVEREAVPGAGSRVEVVVLVRSRDAQIDLSPLSDGLLPVEAERVPRIQERGIEGRAPGGDVIRSVSGRGREDLREARGRGSARGAPGQRIKGQAHRESSATEPVLNPEIEAPVGDTILLARVGEGGNGKHR